MNYLFPMNEQDKLAFQKNWGWFLAWGIALVVLGTLAIIFAAAATYITVLALGILLVAGGVVVIFDSFKSWWGKWSGFFLHLGMGVLYLLLGIMLITRPGLGSLSITFVLAVLYIIIGIMRMAQTFTFELPNRGWRFFSGFVAFVLGLLILAEWPISGLFIIGLFIGIDMLFLGWAYIMTAFAARKAG